MSDVPSNLIPTRITQLPTAPVASEDSLMMIVYNGNNYQIRVGDLLSVAGVPTTRQVIAGTSLTGGGQLSSNVTLSVATGGITSTQLSATGVTAGSYGDATNIPVFTVDSKGRITAASTIAATISGYVPVTREVIAGDGLTGGGPLNANVTLEADLSDSTPLAGLTTGSAGVATSISRSDHKHPQVDLSSANEVENILGLSHGGTARSLTPNAGAIIWSGADGLYVGPPGSAGQVLVSGGTAAPTWGNTVLISDQPANVVYAGPASGAAAPSAFRSLVNEDLPESGVTANTYGSSSLVPVITVNSKGVITGVSNASDTTGVTTAVASGLIASGDVVYYNTGGTVSIASAASVGSSAAPTSAATTSVSSAFDTVNGVAVVCYSTGTSNNGYAAVCNGNSGGTPSYGSSVLFSGATAVADTKIIYDIASAKMLIMYKDTSNNWYGIVGTVSGTTITFGTAVSFTAATKLDIVYGSSTSSSTIAYINSITNTPYFATASVSGTTVSFGSSTVINSSVLTASEIQISRGSGPQFAVIYGYPSFYAVSMSYDGATIANTFTFPTLSTIFKPAICNISQVRFVIAYVNLQNSISVRTLICTSSTSSYNLVGEEVIVLLPGSFNLNLYVDGFSSKILLTSKAVGSGALTYIISVEPLLEPSSPGKLVITNPNIAWLINGGNGVNGLGLYSMVYDTVSQRTIFSFIGGLVRIATRNIKLPSFDNKNIIGIANGAYSTGTTATIVTSGKIATNQTGLSVGSNYYINELTGVKQTSQSIIYLGKAISTTNILVKG